MKDEAQDKIQDNVVPTLCTHVNYVCTADICDMRQTCTTCGAVRDVKVEGTGKVVEGTWSTKGAHPSLAIYAIAQSCRGGQRITLERWSESDRDHLMRVSQTMHVQNEYCLFVHRSWQVALRIPVPDATPATT